MKKEEVKKQMNLTTGFYEGKLFVSMDDLVYYWERKAAITGGLIVVLSQFLSLWVTWLL